MNASRISMNAFPRVSTHLYWLVYCVAALISITLAVIATWSDLEAAFYGFDRRASTPLQNLSCPILLGRNEMGYVSVAVNNPTDGKLSPSVQAEFSTRLAPTASLESVPLAPGESKTLQWSIGPDNVDLQRFIFSKVLIFASYPLPDRQATCGTFVLNLPISGSLVLYVLLGLGLAGLGGGWYALRRVHPKSIHLEKAIQPLTFLTVIIVLALVVSLVGWWVQAVLLLTVTLIATFVTVNFTFFRS